VNISTAVDITAESTEIRSPDYPLAALQQLVRNAIMHRDYRTTTAPARITWFDDRIEIQNPGGPFGQVTCENFGQPGVTDYRNPHLAEAMRNLGYVQRFGVGIQLARKALRENGNPEPQFVVEPSYVLVVVRSAA
jgi:ATP-dependent DNA helicase RecG